MNRRDDVVIFVISAVVASLLIYGAGYVNYLFDRAHIQSLLDQGLALRFQDSISYGFGTFAWWAVLGSIVFGTITAAVVLFGSE